jgi:hypothetical protein
MVPAQPALLITKIKTSEKGPLEKVSLLGLALQHRGSTGGCLEDILKSEPAYIATKGGVTRVSAPIMADPHANKGLGLHQSQPSAVLQRA